MSIPTPTSVSGSSTIQPDQSIVMFQSWPTVKLFDNRNFLPNPVFYPLTCHWSVLPALPLLSN